MSINKVAFWNNRIIGWENKHYKNPFSAIFWRQRLAKARLRNILKNKHVVEVGCGCGRLGKFCLDHGAKSYTGLDLSEAAINEAKEKFQFPNMEFKLIKNFEELPETCDLVFSLGLLDWLSDEERETLGNYSYGKAFLHSYSSYLFKTEIIHRRFIKTYTEEDYIPRIDKHQDIKSHFPNNSKIYWHPLMYLSHFIEDLR